MGYVTRYIYSIPYNQNKSIAKKKIPRFNLYIYFLNRFQIAFLTNNRDISRIPFSNMKMSKKFLNTIEIFPVLVYNIKYIGIFCPDALSGREGMVFS